VAAPASTPDATVVFRPGAGATGYRLRIVESRDAALVGREFHLDGPCLIGRADECNVVLKGDTGVSRRHARIEWTRAGIVLKDEKSANGTWVGDRRVESMLLDHLDRFRVGYSVFELIEDRDETGDDLESIRTTAIPVKEILAEIQSKMAKPLEEEGESVVVAGNKPFFLDDPGSFWLVVEGRLDVFTVVITNGEPGGARTHFTGVETGQAAFGMDLATYGMGSGFLASGKTGVKLRKIPVARAAALAAEGTHVERLAKLVDTWIAALSKALVKDLPAVLPPDVTLAPGDEATLGFQTRAAAKRDVVWIEAKSGELLQISLSEIEGDATPFRVPLTPDAWVDSTVADLTVKAAATASLVGEASFWKNLEVFHQVLCGCEFLNKRLATVDEFNRLRSKASNAEAARVAAYEDIRAVMASPSEKRAERPESADAEPVFQACRSVCRELGMEAVAPPESKGDRSYEDNLQLVAVASRFRTRQVALRGDWWTMDQGPILAKTEESKTPVALLPTSPRSYDWVDVKTGARTPVTAAFARTLEPFGYVFYRRFPDGMLGVRDVVKFGLRGLKPDLRTLVLMGMLMGALGSLTPYFSGRIFDSAIPQAERGLLWQFSIALVVSALSSTAFKLTQSIAVLRLQGKMDYSIQAALWDRLLDLPSTFFRKYSSGDLADRAQGIDAIRGLLQGAGISAVLGAMSSVFYVVLMLSYNVTLAALGIGLTVVFVTFSTTANYLQLRYQRTQMGMNGRLTGLVIQLISGVGKLRVCGAEEHGFRVWAREFAEQRRLSFKVGQVKNVVAVFNSAFPIFASMAIFTTLVWSQSHATGEQAGISTGEFIAFSSAFGLFLAAMQSLSDASLSLLRAVPIWERLKPILTTPAEIDDTKAAPGPIKGAIEISRVHFRYADDAPYILKDLSLKIEPGEFVAFVGGSGCGKSTLMRLMLGFEKAEKGAIYYDGQDLAQLDLRLVRQQLGVVLQDNRVLPADIFRNIVGTSSRTIEEAWEAAEAAGFAEDIRNMPMGMHTYVSEGGGGFSGGQKQRLMIARAIVNKPRVLFLDEATSALDNKTQATVTESMDKMNATRIVIAHRLSTIINAHKICYFEGGIVKEMGTYDELMKKDGLFAALARRQTA
jgi:NHLM bacteriocin system ABC transporter ATP-binding protein